MVNEVFQISRITKDPLVRQTEIMDAAQQLFLAAGYQATTIQDIVKRVQVAQGTFYYHFASKEAVLEAIIARHVSLMLQHTQATPAASASPLAALTACIELFYQICYCSEVSRLCDVLYQEKQGELINKVWRQTLQLVNPVLAPLLSACNEQGLTHVNNIPETLWFLGGIIATLLETSTPLGYRHETDLAALAIKRQIASDLLERLLDLPPHSLHLHIGPDCRDCSLTCANQQTATE